MRIGMRGFFVVIPAGVLLAWASAQAQAPAPPPSDGAPIDAKTLVEQTCVGCHDLSVVTATNRTPKEWSEVVDRMSDYGLTATGDQLAEIKAYLAKSLAKAPS